MFKDDRSNSSTINQQFNGLNISENSAQCQPSCSQTGATGNEVSSGKYSLIKFSLIFILIVNH